MNTLPTAKKRPAHSTIKLARLSNLHPIIGVAGSVIPYAGSLIDKSKGDVTIDDRNKNEAVVTEIKDTLANTGIPQLYHALDAVSYKASHTDVVAVLAPRVTYVFPLGQTAPPGFSYHKTCKSAERSGVAEAYGEYRKEGLVYLQ
jgi:NADPH2:quinone reductase